MNLIIHKIEISHTKGTDTIRIEQGDDVIIITPYMLPLFKQMLDDVYYAKGNAE